MIQCLRFISLLRIDTEDNISECCSCSCCSYKQRQLDISEPYWSFGMLQSQQRHSYPTLEMATYVWFLLRSWSNRESERERGRERETTPFAEGAVKLILEFNRSWFFTVIASTVVAAAATAATTTTVSSVLQFEDRK